MDNEISERGVLPCSELMKKEGEMLSLFWCTQSAIARTNVPLNSAHMPCPSIFHPREDAHIPLSLSFSRR